MRNFMKISSKQIFAISFIAFVFSGFSGLIYQSVWTRYLGLTLGHAAFAQSLVLAIFMGGMALGAWWASRLSSRPNFNVLKLYAIIECVVGIAAFAFHFIYINGTDVVQASILPNVGSESVVGTIKWLWAVVLILPQCILLGMTFPLLSTGLVRLSNTITGEILGTLYFTNSIGAAIGALVSTFYLVPAFGLPNTMIVAGSINIIAGLLVLSIASSVTTSTEATAINLSTKDGLSRERLVLICAFFTGLSSFVYEIVWVRMLSLALGSTTHAFEIMISAFIAGLAFGSFWIRKRIDRLAEPLLIAGWAQLFMGLAALTTIFSYSLSFDGVASLMASLAPTSGGYTLFNIASAFIAILLMFPTAFFAGMTLPVFTASLLKFGAGSQAIGKVYAANTIGAIVGVFLAIHLFLPFLGMKSAIILAALIDIILAVVILRSLTRVSKTAYTLASIIGVGAILISVLAPKFDQRVLASGVYRSQKAALGDASEIVYYRDGKTASVAAAVTGSVVSISTNGKIDASVQMNPQRRSSTDEETMILAAILPMVYHPDATSGANIGFGSGLSTHTALGNPKLTSLDTIEIEPSIVEAAHVFGDRVKRAYSDPRSNIIIDDAKTYFAGNKKKYDFIISEPSNPWVNGIASLFSEEFYKFLPRHLNEEGILVQWIQLYEIDFELIASILKALGAHFDDYDVYFSNGSDLIIVAKHKGKLGLKSGTLLSAPGMRDELKVQTLSTLGEVNLRFFANKQVLNPLVAQTNIRANSDFYPVVSYLAPKSRFMRSSATILAELSNSKLPYMEVLAPASALPKGVESSGQRVINSRVTDIVEGEQVAAAIMNNIKISDVTNALHRSHLNILTLSKSTCHNAVTDELTLHAAVTVASTLASLSPEKAVAALKSDWLGCAREKLPANFILISDLFSAVAARNADDMIKQGLAVLAKDDLRNRTPLAELALCIAVLGLVQNGQIASAATLLEKHREIPFSLESRALRTVLIALVQPTALAKLP
jgi:spermidine synthase